ncbi:MAG: hypothetical protein H7Z41_05935 [Cytophagales bacterium]|nr:hypothetical protein [Armatimonadota bacterium]
MANSRLEEYVQAATARLSESERAFEQLEMRQHLAALIAAQEELGETTEAATDAALKQLGDAYVLRQQLLKAHRRASSHGILSAPFSEFWTINWVPAVFGVVVGGGILGVLYARGRLTLRLSSIMMASCIQTVVVSGFGSMITQSWPLTGVLCTLYWGLLTSCALLGFCLGSISGQTQRQSFSISGKPRNIVKPLMAVGSATLVLIMGGSAGIWQIQRQRAERTHQLAEAVRVAEARYARELQNRHR